MEKSDTMTVENVESTEKMTVDSMRKTTDDSAEKTTEITKLRNVLVEAATAAEEEASDEEKEATSDEDKETSSDEDNVDEDGFNQENEHSEEEQEEAYGEGGAENTANDEDEEDDASGEGDGSSDGDCNGREEISSERIINENPPALEGEKEADGIEGTDTIKPTRMFFKPSEYMKKIKLGTRCLIADAIKTLTNLKPKLSNAEWIWFEDHPQFRHIFHMKGEKNYRVQGLKEVWFIVNGVSIRYGLKEHTLISGLNCRNYPLSYKECGGTKFVDQHFKKGEFRRLEDVKAKLVKMGSHRDRLEMALLFFLASVVCALTNVGNRANDDIDNIIPTKTPQEQTLFDDIMEDEDDVAQPDIVVDSWDKRIDEGLSIAGQSTQPGDVMKMLKTMVELIKKVDKKVDQLDGRLTPL
ncbi:hypothetical protein N665_0339s0050 [Sinapis alba]|nr:hypothetical protein N665_0339s0050 [Sinapis alba]